MLGSRMGGVGGCMTAEFGLVPGESRRRMRAEVAKMSHQVTTAAAEQRNEPTIAAVATQLAAMPCLPSFGPKNTMIVNEASGSSQATSNSLGIFALSMEQ